MRLSLTGEVQLHGQANQRLDRLEPAPAFPLHDINDVPAFCAATMQRALKASSALLSADQRTDLRDYLIERALELASRYDPALGRASFASWMSHLLPLKVASWYRKEFGDARYIRCAHCQARMLTWREIDCSSPDGHERTGLAEVVSIEESAGLRTLVEEKTGDADPDLEAEDLLARLAVAG